MPQLWTQYGLNVLGGRRIRGDAAVYFMDGESLEDIIDFWNLRATGRPVLPLPKQFNGTPQFERLITDYLKEHRVHWRHDPKVCEMAHFIRSRNSTMDEMQAYAKTLKLEIPKGDTSTDGFFALQHWYPRVWDEWARDKDDAVPRDTYAEPDASIDIEDPKELSVRFKPLLPSFADKDGIHSEGRCANDIEFRFYGVGEEGLAFGECKTYRQFEERDFKRMREIAEAFPGAVLVFSTLRKELTDFEIKKMSSITKRGRKYWKSERPVNPVLILRGTELLSFRRAPHCWDDALKQRFSQVHGLMDLCNATQQIYLKLPSWHFDWQQKWDRRRNRLRAAATQATP